MGWRPWSASREGEGVRESEWCNEGFPCSHSLLRHLCFAPGPWAICRQPASPGSAHSAQRSPVWPLKCLFLKSRMTNWNVMGLSLFTASSFFISPYKKFLPLGFPNSISPQTHWPGPLVFFHLDCLHLKTSFPTDTRCCILSVHWNLHNLWGKALTSCQDIWAVVHLYYIFRSVGKHQPR